MAPVVWNTTQGMPNLEADCVVQDKKTSVMMQAGFRDVSAMNCKSQSSNGWESLWEYINRNRPSMGERTSVLSQARGRAGMGGRERGTKRIEDPSACDCNLGAEAVVVRKLTMRPWEASTLARLRKGIKWPAMKGNITTCLLSAIAMCSASPIRFFLSQIIGRPCSLLNARFEF
ncbi:hypothetical protein SUGI_0724460 [Cryptomeria japonica]|nr:hypothetical protein SUGI_0724460 [Cryptomeria japonica]